jgi:predicted transcriptional regulator
MEPDVIFLSRDQSLVEAMTVLAANDIGGAPVCDASGRVVGVLSKTDLVQRGSERPLEGSVDDAMMPMTFSIGPDEELQRAIHIMAFEGIHRLIVLDAQGQLIGILTSMDVLRHIAGFDRDHAAPRLGTAAARG